MSIPEATTLLVIAAAIAGVLVPPDIWQHFSQRSENRAPQMTFEERIEREPGAAAFLKPLVESLEEPYKTSLMHVVAYRHDTAMPTNWVELMAAARNAATMTGIAEDKGNSPQIGPTSAAGLYTLVSYLEGVAVAI